MLCECVVSIERELVFFFNLCDVEDHSLNLFLFNYMVVKINTHHDYNGLNSRIKIYFLKSKLFYLFIYVFFSLCNYEFFY